MHRSSADSNAFTRIKAPGAKIRRRQHVHRYWFATNLFICLLVLVLLIVLLININIFVFLSVLVLL